MIDAQSIDAVLVDPAGDFDVGGGVDGFVLHPQARQCRDGEEAPVVLLGVGPPKVHQLVGLTGMNVHARAVTATRGDREAVLEVAQFPVDHGKLVDVEVIAEDRQQDAPAGPLDVEPGRVRGFAAQPQDVPPGRVLGRVGHPGVIGHDVDDQAEPVRTGRPEQGRPARTSAASGIDQLVGHHVVAMVGALGRL